MNDLRYPKIDGRTTEQQLLQTKLYLHTLVDQLNFALQSVGGGTAVTAYTPSGNSASLSAADKEKQALLAFNDIKALIIKSADIINAYYDEINTRLEGVYVAESDFGSFANETSQDIKANSTSIEQLFTNVQAIVTDIGELEHNLIEVNAYINSGLLYTDASGVPVYGMEVGQSNTIDGVKVFQKFARFTADRLSFYDAAYQDEPIAYISNYMLVITNAWVRGTLQLGLEGKGFVLDTTNGIALRPV